MNSTIMTFTFRPATLEDISILVELRLDFLEEVQKNIPKENYELCKKNLRKFFEKHLKDGTFIAWFAEVDGKIIATSGLSVIEKPPQLKNYTGIEAYIMNMYTLPKWRRKGIGTALMEKMLFESKKRGIHKITLHATADGKPLYEKFGFKVTPDAMHLLK